MDDRPTLLELYSNCTADCEHGQHVGKWEQCDRCGSAIHVRVFVVDHPQHGSIRVGSECFKDVMGYNFTVTHEKAIETAAVLHAYAAAYAAAERRQASGWSFVGLGLPGPVSAAKRLGAYPLLEKPDLEHRRVVYSGNWLHNLKPPRVPHGWSQRIITAGLDLGLWVYSEEWSREGGFGKGIRYVLAPMREDQLALPGG